MAKVPFPTGSIQSLAVAGLGQGILVISGAVTARTLGPSDRGYFALLALIGPIACYVLTLGLPLAVVATVAAHPTSARPVARRLVLPALAQSGIALVVGAMLTVALWWRGSAEMALAAAIASAAAPAWIAWVYAMALLQARASLIPFHIARLAQIVMSLAFLVPTVLLTSGSLLAVTAAWSIGCAVAALAVFVYAISTLPRDPGTGQFEGKLTGFGLRALLGAISPVELLRLDQLAVSLVLAPAGLGIYVVAQSLSNLPRLVAQSVGLVAYPRMARLAAHGLDPSREVLRFAGGTMAVVIPLVVVLILSSGTVFPWVFGSEFAAAAGPARLLLVGAAAVSLRRIVGDCARGLGRGGADSFAEVALWATLFPSVVVFGRAFGISGVAGAAAASAGVSCAVLMLLLLPVFRFPQRPHVRAEQQTRAASEP